MALISRTVKSENIVKYAESIRKYPVLSGKHCLTKLMKFEPALKVAHEVTVVLWFAIISK